MLQYLPDVQLLFYPSCMSARHLCRDTKNRMTSTLITRSLATTTQTHVSPPALGVGRPGVACMLQIITASSRTRLAGATSTWLRAAEHRLRILNRSQQQWPALSTWRGARSVILSTKSTSACRLQAEFDLAFGRTGPSESAILARIFGPPK